MSPLWGAGAALPSPLSEVRPAQPHDAEPADPQDSHPGTLVGLGSGPERGPWACNVDRPSNFHFSIANHIRVENGETYRLMPEVDPAELTVQLARTLEGGDSVTVGIEPPLEREKVGALVIGESASCILVTSDD